MRHKKPSLSDGIVLNDQLEEHSGFVEIDRKKEDKNVAIYQKTKDREIFDNLYKDRIPTLQIWARQYYYLMDSKEDMFGELSRCFYKAVMNYKKNKGSFNTCLYTYLINHIRNIHIGKQAKKRIPQFLSEEINKYNFMLSLEYKYNNKDGSENALKDLIIDPKYDTNSMLGRMDLEETVNYLSHGCPTVRGFLRKISAGSTLASALKEYKTKTGYINVGRKIAQKIENKTRCKSLVKDIIRHKMDIDCFSLINYHVEKYNKLFYTIEMKKTQETNLILRAIRKLRKNKEVLAERIMA